MPQRECSLARLAWLGGVSVRHLERVQEGIIGGVVAEALAARIRQGVVEEQAALRQDRVRASRLAHLAAERQRLAGGRVQREGRAA